MRSLFLLFVILQYSCSKNAESQSSTDCKHLHSIGLFLEPMNESILINYGFLNLANAPIDPPPDPEASCEPESVEILISADGVDFESVTILDELSGSYLIENLQNCEFVTIKVEGSHPDFNTVSATRTGIVGEIPLPQFMNNPLPMEDFILANNTDQMVYRTASDNWYLSSMSSLSQGQLIFRNASRARWSPTESNKVAAVEYILVQILTNTNGISS